MSDIVLSSGVRSNLLQLQNTSDLIAQTQTRLATGKEVNSALDNPTNFFTASSLNARASDLSNILDSLSNAIKTVEAADNALTAITNTVETLQSTARQARQDNSFNSQTFELSDTATGNLTFSGGGLDSAVSISLDGTPGSGDEQQSSVVGGSAFTAPADATDGESTFTFGSGAVVLTDATDTIEIDVTVGTDTQTVTITGADTDGSIDDAAEFAGLLETAINGTFGAGTVSVANPSGDDITITTAADGATGGLAVDLSTASVTDVNTNDTSLTAANLGLGSAVTGTAGDDAETFTITVSDGTNTTADINLTSANAADSDDAVDTIQAAIDAAGIDATVSQTSDVISIEGLADGSNSITVGGAGETDVFGTATTTTGSPATTPAVEATVDSIAALINADTDLTAAGIEATNEDGDLEITFRSTSETDLTVAGVDTTGDDDAIDGGVGTTTIEGNETRRDLETQFNELRTQLNSLADDAFFNGVNLLEGDELEVVFNEQNTSSLTIQSTNTDGVNTTTLGITSVEAGDFASNSSLDTRLDSLQDALGGLRSQAAAFGSNLSVVENREDFTKATINTLESGADNLTLADLNEEGANLLALQTRQQLSTTALSLAAQADQNVLRLF
ncbi:MAG: flagellin [Pseudomonadota bacterium]